MSFFTIGWQAPADIGLLPQHPGDGEDPFFTIAWTPKHQATYYPYNPDELIVGPGGSDGQGGNGNGHGDGVGRDVVAGAGEVPSPVVRAHAARAYVAARKDPALFRRKGLTFAVEVEAAATVTAVLVLSAGGRKLSYSQTRRLARGVDHLTLRASEYGKLMTRRHKRVRACLELTIRYADRSSGTVVRSVVLESAPKNAKR